MSSNRMIELLRCVRAVVDALLTIPLDELAAAITAVQDNVARRWGKRGLVHFVKSTIIVTAIADLRSFCSAPRSRGAVAPVTFTSGSSLRPRVKRATSLDATTQKRPRTLRNTAEPS